MTRLFLEIKNITLCAEPSFLILLYFCGRIYFFCVLNTITRRFFIAPWFTASRWTRRGCCRLLLSGCWSCLSEFINCVRAPRTLFHILWMWLWTCWTCILIWSYLCLLVCWSGSELVVCVFWLHTFECDCLAHNRFFFVIIWCVFMCTRESVVKLFDFDISESTWLEFTFKARYISLSAFKLKEFWRGSSKS